MYVTAYRRETVSKINKCTVLLVYSEVWNGIDIIDMTRYSLDECVINFDDIC